MWLLNLKHILLFVRKKSYNRILKDELNEQYLSIKPKSCSIFKYMGEGGTMGLTLTSWNGTILD